MGIIGFIIRLIGLLTYLLGPPDPPTLNPKPRKQESIDSRSTVRIAMTFWATDALYNQVGWLQVEDSGFRGNIAII